MKTVGIDLSKNFHTCYIHPEDKTFRIEDNADGYERLLKTCGKDCVFITEDSNNRLVGFLLFRGMDVYMLPPRRSKEARKYHSNSVKTDRMDARVIALTYKEHPEYCTKIIRNEFAQRLKTSFEVYEQLTNIIQENKNRLQSNLYDYYPEFDQVMGSKWCDDPKALLLITVCPSILELKKTNNEEIETLVEARGINSTPLFLKKMDTLRTTGKSWEVSNQQKLFNSFLAEQLLVMETKKAMIERELEQELKNSEYGVILSVPGIGVITGVSLVIAYLTHGFSNYREFQRYCGTSPVVIQSGNFRVCKMRRNCNNTLRSLLHMAALSALNKKKSWMRKFYDKKRKEGKTYGHALRALANILLKIIYAMLRDFTPYNEEMYLSLRGNGSPRREYYTTPGVRDNTIKGSGSLPVRIAQNNCHLRI